MGHNIILFAQTGIGLTAMTPERGSKHLVKASYSSPLEQVSVLNLVTVL